MFVFTGRRHIIDEVLSTKYGLDPSHSSGASDGHVRMYREASVITVHVGWKHINLSISRYRDIEISVYFRLLPRIYHACNEVKWIFTRETLWLENKCYVKC